MYYTTPLSLKEAALQDPALTSPKTSLSWLRALFPLLLAAGLVIPALGDIAFNGDEVNSLVDGAGAFPSGPQSLAEVPDHISPEQAMGWPLLLFVWVRIAGWSEVAARALPCFGGLLALAWVYRAGNDLFSPQAGFFAALLLSASLFPQTFMLHARAFPMAMLFGTLCFWSYWHIALRGRRPGLRAQAGLLLGATGLLYSHYFGALLLPVLGLFHLLFVPKNRRWWRPVILLGLAGLTAIFQLPYLLQGLESTAARESFSRPVLTPPELLAQFLRYLVNGMVSPTANVGALLFIVLPVALLIVILQRLRIGRKEGAGWYLGVVSAMLLLLFIAANEVLRVVTERRMRYLITLWPPLALLAGAGLRHLAGSQRRLAAGLLAFWLLLGAWLGLTTEYRYELGFFQQTYLHLAYRAAGEHIPVTDALVVDHEVDGPNWQGFYVLMLKQPNTIYNRHRDDPLKHVKRLHASYPYVWLLFRPQDNARMDELAAGLGRVSCEQALEAWGITLVRYARSPVHCPTSPARLQFDSDIQLTGPDIRLEGGLLRLHAGFRSADNYLLAHYSLAVHIIDPLSGERVAQGDVGVGPGSFAPVSTEIDISALPPGDYEMHVALYDWQTGARLPARDLETGMDGDMHAVYSFRTG